MKTTIVRNGLLRILRKTPPQVDFPTINYANNDAREVIKGGLTTIKALVRDHFLDEISANGGFDYIELKLVEKIYDRDINFYLYVRTGDISSRNSPIR